MAKLTKSYIDQIPIPEKKPDGKPTQAFHRDDTLHGFALRVTSGGTKSFIVERRINDKVKRISIGKYGHLTPTQARNKAHEILGEIALGNDPIARKKADTIKNITLGEVYQDYLKTRKNLKSGTIKTYDVLLNGCVADWLPKRIADISKDMVEARHSEIGANAPARANNVMRTLRAVFNHAIAKYEDEQENPVITSNPIDRLSRNRAWYKIERRRNHLKPHELKQWYEATLQLETDVTRDYFHFLLFTGLRRTEAATLRWENVDFKQECFTILDTKNTEPHTLPFSDVIKELLEHRKSICDSPWVFPSPVDDGHIRDPRGSIEHMHKLMGRQVTLHDLRRTFITIAESLDIPAYALKRLINHKDPNDVTAGYIVINVDRLKEPMQKISEFILEKANDVE